MRKLLIGTGIGLVLIAGAVAALPFLIPASTYKAVIEDQLEKTLDRDVVLANDPKIQFFPQLGASFTDVSISNAEGFKAEQFLTADSLNIAVKWMPLLSRKIEIASAEFVGTEVFLEENRNDRNNWTFGTSDGAKQTSASSETSNGGDGFDAIIPKASLKDSRVSYKSAAQGLNYNVTDINLTAKLDGLDKPFGLTGDLTINEQPFYVDATLTSLNSVIGGESFTVDAAIKSDLANVSYDGDVSTEGTLRLNGVFNSKLTDLDGILRFADIETDMNLTPIGVVEAAGRISGAVDALELDGLSFKQNSNLVNSSFEGDVSIGKSIQAIGNLTAKSNRVRDLAEALNVALQADDASAFKSFNIDLDLAQNGKGSDISINAFRMDDTIVNGSGFLDMSGKTPFVRGEFSIPELDLTRYQNEPKQKKQSSGDSTTTWSEDPINLSALKVVNADVDIDIGRLATDKAEILDLKLSANLKSGRLSGAFSSKEPEGGRPQSNRFVNPLQTGEMNATFNVRTISADQNRITFLTTGSGIAASEIVKFFTGKTVLNGVTTLDADMRTNGASIADFVRNLSGSYDAGISDGAILGVNLAQLVRSAETALKTGQLPNALSPEEETDFSSLALQGNIQSGTAKIDVFELLSPILKVNATGNVDIFNQTLDIQFRPRTLNQTDGENGLLGSVSGFGIPLRIHGNWTSVKGSLDTNFLSDLAAQEAKKRLQSEVSNRVGGQLGGLLGNVLGVPTDPPDETETPQNDENDQNATNDEEEESDIEDVAEGLLKGLIFGD